MAAKSANKLKIGGQLELDVTLKNIKSLEKELKAAQGKIEKQLGQTAKDHPARYNLEASSKSLNAAQKQLNARTALIEKLAKEGKSFSQLTPQTQKKLEKEINGVNAAVVQAKKGFKELSDSTKELSLKDSRSLASAVKSGTNAINRQTTANNKVTGQLTEFSRQEIKQRGAIQAARLRNAKKEQAAQEKVTKDLIKKPVSELSTGERGAVKSTLKGRASLLSQREGLALSRGKSDEKYVEGLSKSRKEATQALKDYDSQVLTHNKRQRDTAAAAKEVADQDKVVQSLGKARVAADKEQARIDKAADSRVQSLGRARVAADKEQARIDKAADSRVQSLGKARVAADKEQARIDKAADGRVQSLGKARVAADKEQARIDKAKDTRIQNLGKAESAAYVQEKKRISDIAKVREAATVKEARAETKRLAFARKQTVGEDVLRNYGAKDFAGLNYGKIQRQDIKPLLEYAKAQTDIRASVLARAKAEKAGGPVTEAANRKYQESANVVRQLDNQFRKLHSPLAQVNLLFRQFLRFAVGYGALYQVLGAINGLVKGVVDLDESLRSIQAITGSTNRDMASLERTIKRIAVTTKFTTTEIAKATQVLGQAGVGADELPAALQATADFAAATASSLEISADLITTTRNVFKELNDETLANQLTKAVNISKLTAQDLKTILSLGAQTAQSYNLTSEQFLGAVTVLRNAGLKASTVATGLRQGLIEVFSPDSSSVKAIKERYDQLGEQVTEEAVKQRFFGFTKAQNPLLAVLTELKRIGFADDASKEFSRAFDVRAANAIKALIKNFDELAAAEVKITFGLSAAEAAEIQMKSLANSLSNLGAAFTVLGDAVLGDAVGGMESLVDSTTNAIVKLTELDIALKKQGKDGLGASLIPALAGAGAGAILGKSAKGKILLGTFGGVAGGASGLAGSGESGGTVGSAVGSTVLTGLLVALGIKEGSSFLNAKRLASDPKQPDLFGANSKRGFFSGQYNGGASAASKGGATGLAKLGAKASSIFGKFGGAKLVGLIPLIGPFLQLALTVYTVYEAMQAIFSDGGSASNQAENKLKGLSAELDSLKAKNEKAQAGIKEFDVAGARSGGATGTTAATLVEIEKKFGDYRSGVYKAFGNLTKGQSSALDEILKDFSKSNLAGRQPLSEQIKDITGSEASLPEIDRMAYDLSNSLVILTDSSSAIVGDLGDMMQATYDRILDSDEAAPMDLATAELYQNSDELRRAVLGLTTVSSERLNQLVIEFAQARSDIERGQLAASGASEADIAAKGLEKVKAEVVSAVLTSENIPAIDLQTQLNVMIDSLIALEGASADTIASFTKAIDEGLALAEKIRQRRIQSRIQSRRAATDHSIAGGAGRLNDKPEAGQQDDKPEAGQQDAKLSVVRKNSLAYATKSVADIQQAERNANEAAVTSAIAQIESLQALQESPAGRAALDVALAGATDASAKAALENVLSVQGGLQALGDEIVASGLVEDANDPSIVKGFKAIVVLAKTANEQANTALEGQRRVNIFRETLPDPKNIARVAELDRTIRSRQGKDKSNIDSLLSDNSANPINQRRDILAVEKNKEINKIQDQINIIDPTGKRAQITTKDAEKLNKLETRLEKAKGELFDLDEQALQAIQDVRDKYNAIILKRRDQAANLEIEVAEQNIGLSGQSGNADLFDESINKIDSANAELIDVFKQQLIDDGISPYIAETADLYKKEVSQREYLLRSLKDNTEQFTKYLDEFTSGLREQAQLLRDQPITLGSTQDALSASQGTEGDARRAQSASLNLGAVSKLLEENRIKRDAQTDRLPGLSGEEAAETQLDIDRLNQSMVALQQESVSLALTMMENSSIASERANAELAIILNTQLLTEGLQDSEYAFKNLGERINDTFLDAVEGIGAAISKAVLDGDNFIDLISNLFNEIGREMATTGIQTLVNELATTGLQALQSAGFSTLIGGAGETAAKAVTDTAAGAVGEAAEAATLGTSVGLAVTTSLLPATLGLQTANTNLFLAGTQLSVAAGALTTAAATMAAGGAAEAGGDLLTDIGKAVATSGAGARGGILKGVKGFAKGTAGKISGPGTGTSDSILAAYLNNSKVTPIRVANGESILTAKATDALGEGFINFINKKGKIPQFNSGAVTKNQGILASGAKPAQQVATASPAINNRNETTIVNAIDSSSVVSAALETPAGGRAIMNYLRANKSKISRIIQ